MPRVRLRRVVLAVVLTLIGGVALAGCQTQPGTAGYVGDTRFTDDQVDSASTAIEADFAKTQEPPPIGDVRQFVAESLVFNEVLARYAKEQGVVVPPVDYTAIAQSYGLPEADPFVHLAGDQDAIRAALLAKATPVTPTDADYRAMYEQLRKFGVPGTFEEVQANLAKLDSIPKGIALRTALADASKRYNVGISPRYQPAEARIAFVLSSTGTGNQSIPVVVLPLGSGTSMPPVLDLPATR
jgi:hypothetical protein